MRSSLLLIVAFLCSPVLAISPDSLPINGTSGRSSGFGSASPRSNWHEVEREIDRGNHRVVDDATWTLDEIHLNRAVQSGRFREFDFLQIERDRQEQLDRRDGIVRMNTRAPIPAPLSRGDTLRGGYLGMLYDPANLIYPRKK